MGTSLPILRTQHAATLCSVCPEPGHCCKRFYLGPKRLEGTLEEAQQYIDGRGFPFTALGFVTRSTCPLDETRNLSEIVCTCPKLTPEGLCSIYESRPALCRNYQPGSDPLCIFKGTTGLGFWPKPVE